MAAQRVKTQSVTTQSVTDVRVPVEGQIRGSRELHLVMGCAPEHRKMGKRASSKF